jgi:hypothetical protein
MKQYSISIEVWRWTNFDNPIKLNSIEPNLLHSQTTLAIEGSYEFTTLEMGLSKVPNATI